ncbi:hypothetical protein DIS18_00610 [Algibacter marinivivus]|uniref:Peptidase M56 domain-containing protein n=1 Tax=Algibacter marinivivus TaxID=2100723 RepID=A0A2U2X5S3_9FLAO|nr:M56 family metallopeptidase [Algibacter marinivivus]PWH83090.1 hypothetical protein DIS18_00610 [Algibacter marinivivus]
MEYLIKASGVIAVFYLFYKLLLERDTFFKSNRWFLLVGLLIAIIVPSIVIPVYIEYTPIDVSELTFENVATAPANSGLEFWDYVIIAYALGVVFFFGRFFVQMSSLLLLIFKNKKEKQGKYTYVKTKTDISPFSFFNWIVYNPTQFNKTELKQIIAHEKVHAKQYHSIDILLTHLACVVLWFNPFIWLYNKDLKQNLEFLADYDTVRQTACKKTYQYTLLKTSVPTHQLVLSNNFYNSLIKKRIVMLQKSKSKKINKIKYALVIPLLVIFLMSFNTKDIYIKKAEPVFDMLPNPVLNNLEPEKSMIVETPLKTNAVETITTPKVKNRTINNVSKKEVEVFIVTKNASDADLDQITSEAKAKGVTLKFKNVKRNADGEITAIKIEARGNDSNASYNLNSDEPITPIKISFGKKGKNISIGNANVKQKSVTYIIKNGSKVSKVKGTGSGTENIFISNDDGVYEVEGDSVHYITKGRNSFTKRIKTVDVIKNGDNDDTVEIIVDNDGLNENEDIIIVKKDKPGKTAYKVKAVGKGKSNNKVIIKTDDGTEPIYIIDGKEVKNKAFKTLDNDDIKSINVLKGDSAIKKYGDRAKNGVVEITTKD